MDYDQQILALCGGYVSMLHSILQPNCWVEYDISLLDPYLSDEHVTILATYALAMQDKSFVLCWLRGELGQLESHQKAYEKLNPAKAMVGNRVMRCMMVQLDDCNRMLVCIK